MVYRCEIKTTEFNSAIFRYITRDLSAGDQNMGGGGGEWGGGGGGGGGGGDT